MGAPTFGVPLWVPLFQNKGPSAACCCSEYSFNAVGNVFQSIECPTGPLLMKNGFLTGPVFKAHRGTPTVFRVRLLNQSGLFRSAHAVAPLLKIGSPFGPLFEYFGSPFKMGKVLLRQEFFLLRLPHCGLHKSWGDISNSPSCLEHPPTHCTAPLNFKMYLSQLENVFF